MKISVALATLATLLLATMVFSCDVETTPVEGQEQVLIEDPSIEAAAAPSVDLVLPGQHGDVFRHNTAARDSYFALPRTRFASTEAIHLRAYVTAEYEDAFKVTFYVRNGLRLSTYPASATVPRGGRYMISCPFVGQPGTYYLTAKVETAIGSTTDRSSIPFRFVIQ
jgi:hypothetical protein